MTFLNVEFTLFEVFFLFFFPSFLVGLAFQPSLKELHVLGFFNLPRANAWLPINGSTHLECNNRLPADNGRLRSENK